MAFIGKSDARNIQCNKARAPLRRVNFATPNYNRRTVAGWEAGQWSGRRPQEVPRMAQLAIEAMERDIATQRAKAGDN